MLDMVRNQVVLPVFSLINIARWSMCGLESMVELSCSTTLKGGQELQWSVPYWRYATRIGTGNISEFAALRSLRGWQPVILTSPTASASHTRHRSL